MATASEVNEIIKLYVGYYNRAPDPLGLNFWIDQFDGGFSLDAMAVDFSTQDETLANYPFFENPNPSAEDYGSFIDSVYQNLFNRSPDDEGKNFWVTNLEEGRFTVGEAISLIIEGATTSPDQDVVANKVAVGLDFYNDLNPVAPLYEFQPQDVAEATAIQAGVTEDPATIANAAARTDEYVDNFDDGSGRTINLTSNIDTPGGAPDGADTQGGNGADIYQAVFDENGISTLQSSDSIAAGGGDDTLNLRLISTGPLSEVSLNATGLENIVIESQGMGPKNLLLDLESSEDVEQITVEGGAQSFIGGIAALNVAEDTFVSIVDFDNYFAVEFQGDRASGSDDAFDLYIEDSGTADRSTVFSTTETNLSETDKTFEIANIDVGGVTDSFLELSNLTLEQINVTGSQKLHLADDTDGFEELELVDASAMTGGGVSVDANGSTETAFTFLGSDFDDSLMVSNDLLRTANALDFNGGDGTDTLMLSSFRSDTVDAVNRLEGFEILTSTGASTTLRADNYTDIDTFVFEDQFEQSASLSILDVTDDDLFIFNTDLVNGGTTQFAAASVGQSLNLEMRATAEEDGQIEFIADPDPAIAFTGNSVFADVNIHSAGTNSDANFIGSNSDSAIRNDDGPTNFNITGDQALTIMADEGISLTVQSNNSGFSSSVNLDGSAATGDLRIAGSESSDAIEGGSGDDIIYGLGGNDVLTGNAGADQFRLVNRNDENVIMDFTSGEDVVGLWRTEFHDTIATQEGTVLSTDDYFENISSISSITEAEDGSVIEMQTALSQTQIETATGGVASAFLLVFNSTTEKGELWYEGNWENNGTRDKLVTFDHVDSLEELIGFSNTDFVEYLF